MNLIIIKTMQFIVCVYFVFALVIGISAGVGIAEYWSVDSTISFPYGSMIYRITTPGAYILFGFIGLILSLLIVAPILAGWTILYSNNQLLAKIERNTAAQLQATINITAERNSSRLVAD